MFPTLPHLDIDESVLHAIGLACDARAAARQEARTVEAGWPIFGQYIAHDITADRSAVTHHDDEALIRNVRSARLNLEALYGDGPVGNPYLFTRHDPAKLLLGGADDLPRNSEGIALVGDPRQDVHGLMSQLQVRMIKAHNKLVDRLREDGVDDSVLFEEAQRALGWHYQWVCLFDFLPAVTGAERTRALLESGPRFYKPSGKVAIPFEFADAAFRFGHSQVRESYQLARGGPSFTLFPDLIGFRPVPPSHVIDWTLFFDVPGLGRAQRARPIDGCLPAALAHLPVDITGSLDDAEADFESLAVRDLQRGTATGLPSGESVAELVGAAPLTREQVGLAKFGWSGETPLWYYVSREAAVLEEGERLGPVGALIVGEVLLGIVDGDPESFRAVDRTWRPTLPSRDPSRFGVADLVLAG